ncbi:MAG: hypothetical protein M3P89_09600 [Actinomycetota bacterium]|nr:hypothetical protein [Actinomycetota bacterium]
MLTAGEQSALVPGDPHHLALHLGQGVRPQDQLVGVQRRPPVELQQGLPVAEHLRAEGEHLPPEDVVLEDRGPDLRCCPGRGRGIGAHDLQRDPLEAELRRRPAQQQDRPHIPFNDQVHAASQAGGGPRRPDRRQR